jgi:DDE family transposase
MGRDVAIDASDMPAYANGQRFLSKNGPERERFSDPDASWGHRSAVSTRKGGGYYGFKIHAAICARTGLPLAWQIATARDHESLYALPLIDAVRDRGFKPVTCSMDKGYDSIANHEGCAERQVHPVIAYRERTTCASDDVPTCEHGRWTFAGADFKRGATKWRCPDGRCAPKSVWIKTDRRNPIIPRETKRWRDLYRGPRIGRAGVRSIEASVRVGFDSSTRIGEGAASR